MQKFDIIIVGAGSAGCVIANRLSTDPACRVLLLEAGPEDKNRWIHIPAGMARLFTDREVNWAYSTEPEKELSGKRVYWPRGKTLGGSSSINGMAYVRGIPSDYDHWARMGNTGWGWDDLLPLFRRSETYWAGETSLHGGTGELANSNCEHRMGRRSSLHRATQCFIDGALAVGIAPNNDFNGSVLEGAGWIDHNVTRWGRRASSATAFLNPIRNRPNLTIETNATVERIVIEGGRAVAVDYRRNGAPIGAWASKEIVLSAGAVNSPQILMLSGIGPATELRAHGIEPRVHSPEVGKNLQDHMYVHWVHEVRPGYSFNQEITGSKLLLHLLSYYLRGKGLLTAGASSAYIFSRSSPNIDAPDIQIGFRAFSAENMVSGKPGAHNFPGWSASVSYLQPKSRGEIRLRSTDPSESPAIHANYLSHDDDLRAVMSALRLVEKVYSERAIKNVLVRRLAPAEDITRDEALEAYVRRSGDSMYHPCGTCVMGPEATAVVDSRLRVPGALSEERQDTTVGQTAVFHWPASPCSCAHN